MQEIHYRLQLKLFIIEKILCIYKYLLVYVTCLHNYLIYRVVMHVYKLFIIGNVSLIPFWRNSTVLKTKTLLQFEISFLCNSIIFMGGGEGLMIGVR